jgi:vacuolar-type H+-ATPase subunit F/Vma7
MPGVLFIGDELTAAGFRLIGCEIATPAAKDVPAVFAAAVESHAVVLVAAAAAQRIAPAALEVAMRRLQPLVAVIPDIEGRVTPPDVAARIRAQLGVEA